MKKPKKYIGPTICAVLIILLMSFYLLTFLFVLFVSPVPLPILLLFLLVPSAVIVGIVLALRQRYQEIKGGEEDDASQY